MSLDERRIQRFLAAREAVQGRAEFPSDGDERRALVARLLAKYDPRLERIWAGRQMPAGPRGRRRRRR